MAGRGRGRGGMKSGFNKALADQLGIQKNELVKENTSYTPETFPPLHFQPAKNTEERSIEKTYMVMVKKEIREHFRNSEYFISLGNKKPDIERYCDRFHCLSNKPSLHLDWSRYPKELWYEEEEKEKKNKKKTGKKAKVNIKCARSSIKLEGNLNVGEKLSKLEEKEAQDVEKVEEEEEERDESVMEDDDDVDEEMDEGTDYMNSHFDNGESYVEDDGDALEEAVY